MLRTAHLAPKALIASFASTSFVMLARASDASGLIRNPNTRSSAKLSGTYQIFSLMVSSGSILLGQEGSIHFAPSRLTILLKLKQIGLPLGESCRPHFTTRSLRGLGRRGLGSSRWGYLWKSRCRCHNCKTVSWPDHGPMTDVIAIRIYCSSLRSRGIYGRT